MSSSSASSISSTITHCPASLFFTNSSKPTNLREYFKNLNVLTIDKLYANSSSCCLAIFGQLSTLAKHYVLRLLFVEQGIPKAVLSSWVTQKSIE